MLSARFKTQVFTIAVYCATFATVVGCGKHQAAPIEAGPRVSSLYTATNGGAYSGLNQTSQLAGTGAQMQLTLLAGPQNNQPLIFQINANQATPTTSAPQIIADTEYVLQSLCIDSFCDRVAFLLVMTTYAPGTLVATPNQGAYYGGQNRYMTGRSSKAFFFLRNINGQMEQAKVISGMYTNVTQALADLGAHN